MKLTIEIEEYFVGEKVKAPFFDARIQTHDKNGDNVRDKQCQTEEVARLIELSEMLKATMNEFYSTRTIRVAPREEYKADLLETIQSRQKTDGD